MNRVRTQALAAFGNRDQRSNIYPTLQADDGSTVDLDFLTGALPSGVTFSRSNGVQTTVDRLGYITSAANNVPRFPHHPVTKEVLGLLIEPLTSNYAGDFQASLNTTIEVTGAYTLNPMGGASCTKVTKTSNSVGYVAFPAVRGSVGSPTGWAASVFVKRGDADVTVSLEYNQHTDWGPNPAGSTNSTPVVTYNLTETDCTVVSSNGVGVLARCSEVQKYPNGWYRISMAFNMAAASSASNPLFLIRHTGPTDSFMFVFGQQFEAALLDYAVSTSYIPHASTGAFPTRQADALYISGANLSRWLNQSQGTFYVENCNHVKGQNNAWALRLQNGTNDNNWFLVTYGFSGSQLWYYQKTGTNAGVGLNSLTLNPAREPSATKINRYAVCYNSSDPDNGWAFAANGGVTSTNTVNSGTRGPQYTNDFNTLFLGGASSSYINHPGCLRRFKYWPTRLSNNSMKALSTNGQFDYARSTVASNDGSTINCLFDNPDLEGVLPSIMSFTRGSSGTYMSDSSYIVGWDSSTTSNTIGTGTKTFTLSATAEIDRMYRAGEKIVINNGANSMSGSVDSYNKSSQSLVVKITATSGSGTFASWSIGRNELRWEWNAAGTELQGVLIEGQRTNYLNWSESFATSGGTNNNWTRTNITLFTGNNPSPDGSDNAIAFAASASNATIIASSSVGGAGSQVRTFSVWLRRNSGSGNVQLTMNNGTNWFTQSVTSTWQRFAVTVEQISHQPGIRIATANDRVEIWGAQLEDGDHPTSYIPNLGWRNTRNADQLQVNFSYGGVNPYNPNYGTILSSIGTRGNLDGYGFAFAYSDDSYVYEGEGLGFNSLVETNYEFGNGVNFDASSPQSIVSSYNTVDEVYQTSINDMLGNLYATEVLTSPGAFPNGNLLTNIWVGSFDASSGHIDGHVRRFVYYPFEIPFESTEGLNGYVPAQPA